ncbi:hypothetical protein J6590_071633 [Homalodisca vitripennis]|nr:hypothetical protein J6590_071633 [Homalodisca vitripennis]
MQLKTLLGLSHVYELNICGGQDNQLERWCHARPGFLRCTVLMHASYNVYRPVYSDVTAPHRPMVVEGRESGTSPVIIDLGGGCPEMFTSHCASEQLATRRISHPAVYGYVCSVLPTSRREALSRDIGVADWMLGEKDVSGDTPEHPDLRWLWLPNAKSEYVTFID